MFYRPLIGALFLLVPGVVSLGCTATDTPGPQTTLGDRVELALGPSGGSLENGASVKLVVPAGALAASTVLTVDAATVTEASLVARLADAGIEGTLVSRIWQLGPPATTFAVPATVTLPHDAAAGADVVVVWLAGEGDEPASVASKPAGASAAPTILTPASDGVVVTATSATFQTGTLGIGAVIQRTSAPTCASFDGVCSPGCSYALDKDCCQSSVVGTAQVGASRVIDSDADGVHGIALGDLDGDGLADVVAALENRRRVVVYPSAAGAGFGTRKIVDAGVGARDVDVADVDGDGDLDVLAALGDDGAALYVNGGDGTLGSRTVIYPHGRGRAQGLTTADLDGDGKLDVLLSTATGLVSLVGDGAGAFGSPVDVWGPVSPRHIAGSVADVDGDGVTDLLVTWFDLASGDASLSWHKGSAGGTFAPPTEVSGALGRPYAAVFSDVDADAKADLVVADSELDQVLVYPGLGSGQFGPPDVAVAGLDGPQDVIVTQLDGDGVADIVVAASNDDEIGWYVRTGPGKFALKGLLDNGMNGASAVVAGDADGDGDLDLAYAATTNDRVAWFMNGGLCQCSKDEDCADENPCTITSCDVAGDRCEVVVAPACCTDDAACDDGDPCTANKCTAENTCASAPIEGCCEASTECTADACHTVACVQNQCKQTAISGCCVAASDCDDGKECTEDACVSDQCTHTAIEGCCQTDAECDDEHPCTTDTCTGLACTHTFVAEGCPKPKLCESLLGALVCDAEALTTPYCDTAKGVRQSLPPDHVQSAVVSLDECLSDTLLAPGAPIDAACQKDPECVVSAAAKDCAPATLERCAEGLSDCDGAATGGAPGFSAAIQRVVDGDPTALAAADLDGDPAHEVIVATSALIRRMDFASNTQTTVDDGHGAVQVAIGALDGAGPSVVALDGAGALRLYRPVGSDSYVAEVLPDVGAKAALALADMDGDGDRDIVRTGTATGWHQNPGWAWKPIAGVAAGLEVVAADISADGDMDVIVRTASSVVTLERTGAEAWAAPIAVVASAVDTFAWMNGTVVAAAGGQLTWYAPLGQGAVGASVAGFSPTQALRAADLNRDMRADLLAWAETTGGLQVRWLETRLDGLPIAHVVLEPGDTKAKPTGALPVVADVDGDGQLDIVTAMEPGRVRAYLGRPMCCTKASDCEDDNACTVESCTDGGCVHSLAAGCCATDVDCDDGLECTKDTCEGQECASSPAPVGTPCGQEGYCDGAASPTCAECTEDDHCSDEDSCTTDSCEGGGCEHTPVSCDDGNGCTVDSCQDGACTHETCAEVTLGWNELDGIPDVATAEVPFVFSILGWSQSVSFHRTGNASLVRTYTPPAAIDGAFVSDTLAGVSLTWEGEFPYIDVLSDGLLVTGSVTFDFGGAATEISPSHRFVLVVGGTGGAPGEGPTTVVCDVPLTPLGNFDAFFTGAYATFTAPSTLVSSSTTTDGLSYYALPGGTTTVTCTIESGGSLPDPHGYAVGLIDTDVTICAGSGQDAQCVENICGDGINRDGEACDDGDLDNFDGCSSTCMVEPGAVCTGDLRSTCMTGN